MNITNMRIVGACLAVSTVLFAYPAAASAEVSWRAQDTETCARTDRSPPPPCVSMMSTNTNIRATNSCSKEIALVADVNGSKGDGSTELRKFLGVRLRPGDSASIDLSDIVSPLEIASGSLGFSRVKCCRSGPAHNACAGTLDNRT